MLISVFADVLLPILFIVGAGFAFRRMSDVDVRPISRVSLYLLSPALIFSALVEADFAGGETVRVVAFMLLLVAALAALTWTAVKLLGYSRETGAAMMLCTLFSNTGNYGLPLAFFAFGQEGFERAIIFFVMQAILTQTIGVYIAGSGNDGWRGGLKRLVGMPQIYAVGAAFVVRWIGPEILTAPDSVLNDLFRGITLLGDAAIPMLLVILGVQLAEAKVESGDGVQIGVATGIRLLAAIPISYGLAVAVGLDPLSTKLAVILGSMPTAVNVTIFAVEFDVRPGLVSSTVTVSTALSFATLAVLLSVLGAGQ